MGSALLDSVADAARKVEESLGRLIEVELRRRTGDRNPVTGSPAFAAPVTVKAKVQGPSLLDIGAQGSLRTGRYDVTLYGEAVEAGDRIRFGGEDHTVREVAGVLRDGSGRRYIARVTVD